MKNIKKHFLMCLLAVSLCLLSGCGASEQEEEGKNVTAPDISVYLEIHW